MSSEIIDIIKSLIYEHGFGYKIGFPFFLYKINITRDTRIQQDLKIYGDDSAELINAFAEKFGVDINSFRIEEYFDSEGDKGISFLINKLTNKKKKKLKTLTIGDLENAVLNGRLV